MTIDAIYTHVEPEEFLVNDSEKEVCKKTLEAQFSFKQSIGQSNAGESILY